MSRCLYTYYIYIYIYTHVYTYLSIYLSIYLSVYLCVYLSLTQTNATEAPDQHPGQHCLAHIKRHAGSGREGLRTPQLRGHLLRIVGGDSPREDANMFKLHRSVATSTNGEGLLWTLDQVSDYRMEACMCRCVWIHLHLMHIVHVHPYICMYIHMHVECGRRTMLPRAAPSTPLFGGNWIASLLVPQSLREDVLRTCKGARLPTTALLVHMFDHDPIQKIRSPPPSHSWLFQKLQGSLPS